MLLASTISDPSRLAAVLAVLTSEFHTDHICMEFWKRKGVQIRAIDAAQCSFLDVFFAAKGSIFSKFECAKDYMPLYISPVSLQKALKTTVGTGRSNRNEMHSVAHLKVGEEMDVLEFIVETNRNIRKSTKFYLSLLEPLGDDDICQLDPSDFSFKVEAYTCIPSLFEEVISQLAASECDEVCITFQKDCLIFDAGGNSKRDSRAQIVMERDDDNLQIRAEKGSCQASFHLKFLNRVSRLCKQACDVLLQLGPETPLSIVFHLNGGGACQLFVSPLMDSEE